MRLQIKAIGAKPGAAETALIDDYAKRANAIGRNIGFSGPDIETFEAPRSLSGAKRQAKEGALLLSGLSSGTMIITLDERGRNIPSEKLAEMLGRWRDDGVSNACFLIGGADGHDKPALEQSTLRLSFGALTWPHMLVRVMLAEQLYRAMTILSGHPYHRS
ncbi:MAG: 23S rRNA (pseudouridine(1915)-N(3))-methyltransferase RlmH [Pseudomonadota bacterium]